MSNSSLYSSTPTSGTTSSSNTTGLYGASDIPMAGNNGDVVIRGNLAVIGGNITTTAATATLFNANATTLNIGGDATSLFLGAVTGLTTINNSLLVDGTLSTPFYTFPNVDGAATEVLTTDGAGNLYWSNPAAGGVTSLAATNHLSVSSATGDITITSDATASNVASTIVARDSGGDIYGNQFWANKVITPIIQATTSAGIGIYSSSATSSIAVGNGFADITNNSNTWHFTSTGATQFPHFTFPSSDGTANQVLTTNGSGIVTWSTPIGAVISVNGKTGVVVLTTTDIAEGTNQYFTTARARAAISASGSLTYSSTTGVISYTTPTTIASLSNHTTTDLAEGTNQYFTTARARASVSAGSGISYDSATGVITATTGGVTSLAASNHLSVDTSTGAVTVTSDATPTNTASTIVARDSTGTVYVSKVTAPTIQADTSAGISVYSNDANSKVTVGNGTANITNNSNTWQFTSTGATQFPHYTFPSADGTGGQALQSNGAGVLSWYTPTDANTTYTYSAVATTNGANLRLTGSDSTTNTIKLNNGGHITAVYSTANVVTLGSDATASNVANTIVLRDVNNHIYATAVYANVTTNLIQADAPAGLAIYSNSATSNLSVRDGYASITNNGNSWQFSSTGATQFPHFTLPSADGTANQVLTSNGSGTVSWATPIGAVSSVNGQTGAVVLTTTNIAEGTNLYYTDTRARAAISASGSLSYNSTTGVISYTTPVTVTSLAATNHLSVSSSTGAITVTSDATTANTASTIVARDASSNIQANTAFATLFQSNAASTGSYGSGSAILASTAYDSSVHAYTGAVQMVSGANAWYFNAADGALQMPHYTFPGTDGTNGQYLVTNGTGVLTWTTAPANVASLAATNHLSVSSSTGAITVTSDATTANTASTIVARDASSNIYATKLVAATVQAPYSSATMASVTSKAFISAVETPIIPNGQVTINITGGTAPQWTFNSDGTINLPGWSLPAAGGGTGEVLTSNGLGVSYWAAGGGYTLPTASTTVLGGVKVDGTTITINSTTGVISSSGGGGSTDTFNPFLLAGL